VHVSSKSSIAIIFTWFQICQLSQCLRHFEFLGNILPAWFSLLFNFLAINYVPNIFRFFWNELFLELVPDLQLEFLDSVLGFSSIHSISLLKSQILSVLNFSINTNYVLFELENIAQFLFSTDIRVNQWTILLNNQIPDLWSIFSNLQDRIQFTSNIL